MSNVQEFEVPDRKVSATSEDSQLISKQEVLRRVNLTYPTVWKRMREGSFPRSRDNGGKAAWLKTDIDFYIANRPLTRLKGDKGAA